MAGQQDEQTTGIGGAKKTGLYSAAARKRREKRAHAQIAGQWMVESDHSTLGNWLSRREKTFWKSEGGLVMKLFGIGTCRIFLDTCCAVPCQYLRTTGRLLGPKW